jgi:hypothetical protein
VNAEKVRRSSVPGDPKAGLAERPLFFSSPDLGLDRAGSGTFSLSATDLMFGELRRDYARMAGMIIGAPPEFDEVMSSVTAVEREINR